MNQVRCSSVSNALLSAAIKKEYIFKGRSDMHQHKDKKREPCMSTYADVSWELLQSAMASNDHYEMPFQVHIILQLKFEEEETLKHHNKARHCILCQVHFRQSILLHRLHIHGRLMYYTARICKHAGMIYHPVHLPLAVFCIFSPLFILWMPFLIPETTPWLFPLLLLRH